MAPVLKETDARVEVVASVAGQTVFDADFRLDEGGTVKVWLVGSMSVSLLVQNTDYEISGFGNDNGFMITLLPGGAFPAGAELNDRIIAERASSILRETAFPEGGDFTATAANDQANYSVQVDQELRRDLDRTLGLAGETIFGGSLELPTPEALKLFMWNETATALIATELPALLDGEGPPAPTLGEIGDRYTDLVSGLYYAKIGETTWEERGSLRGPEGQPGSIGTIADGSAAAPSIAFGLDPDTGIFRPFANTWAVTVGGSEIARYAPTGIRFLGELDMGNSPIVNRSIKSRDVGGSATLAASDAGGRVVVTGGGTITVPTALSSLMPANAVITLRQETEEQVDIRAAGGVTINSRGGLIMGGPDTEVTLERQGSDVWSLTGDLATRPLNTFNLFNISNFV